MILSIRHRIFLPFLFITMFMAFSSMFIAIEMVQKHFNTQLFQMAQRQVMPIQTTLSQLAIANTIQYQTPDSPVSLDQIHEQWLSQPQMFARIDQQELTLTDATQSTRIPFLLASSHFKPMLSSLYVKHRQGFFRIYHSPDLTIPHEQHLSLDHYKTISSAGGFIDQKIDNEHFRSYFFDHHHIKHLMIRVAIPSTTMLKKQQLTLTLAIGLLFLINAFIIFIFFFILKRTTQSLSKITDTAKQLSKGLRTAPLTVNSNDEIGLLAQSFNHMLNNVQTKTAELIYERNRSKMILAQLPEGIIVTDLNNKLLSANRAAEMMLGFSTDRARGHEIISYLKNENLSSFFNHEFRFVKDNAVVRELVIPGSNGQDDHYQITVSPLLDSTYQKTGMITVIRNITEEKKSRLLKDNFLHSVTHELRTPLTSIIGFLNILSKEAHGSLNDTQKEFLSISVVNSNTLKKLINDLLELSIIHSGQLILHPTTIALPQLFSGIVQEITPMIDKKANQISVDYQDSHMELVADPEKITTIIKNLILNANKSTDNGHIECIFTQTPAFTTFVVKDSGSGLTDDYKQKLMAVFEQSSHDSHYYDGLGLELAVVKELVQVHHGQIFIESKVDHGATYTVTIPHQPPSHSQSPTPAEEPALL